MSSQGREEMFWKIMVFFAVVTAITAIFNLSASGVMTIHTFGNSGVLPGQTVPNFQTLPGYSENTILTEQDYTISTGYDLNTTIIKGGWIALGPLWTQADGIGMTCMNIPILPPFTPAYLLIKGAIATNNNYTVTYTVDAQGHEFNTIIYRSDPQDPGLFIQFDNDGAHLRDEMLAIENIYFTGANNAHTIKTEYNTLQQYIDLWLDGNYIDRFTRLNEASQKYAQYPNTIYAGVFSTQTGVIVEKIETKIQKQAPDPGLLYSLGFGDLINLIFVVGSLIGGAMGLTSNPAVPFWLWAIVGLPCVATLSFMYLEILRGV